MKLLLISASLVALRQLRNQSIGWFMRFLVSLHTSSLLILMITFGFNDHLLEAQFAHALIYQFVEFKSLQLSRYNYLEEQQQIRQRFGLEPKRKTLRDQNLIYYKKIIIFNIITLLVCINDFTKENLMNTYIENTIIFQLFNASTIISEYAKILRKQDDYREENQFEYSGLISKSLIIKKETKIHQKLLKYINTLKELLIKLIIVTISIVIISNLVINIISQYKNEVYVDIISKLFGSQTNIYINLLIQLIIYFLFINIGYRVFIKKWRRTQKLYENVRKEQEKLQIEGQKCLSAMIYASQSLIIFINSQYNPDRGIIFDIVIFGIIVNAIRMIIIYKK